MDEQLYELIYLDRISSKNEAIERLHIVEMKENICVCQIVWSLFASKSTYALCFDLMIMEIALGSLWSVW